MNIEIVVICKTINWKIIDYLNNEFKNYEIKIVTPNKVNNQFPRINIISDSEFLDQRSINDLLHGKIKRIGWYFQQLLKYEVVLNSVYENVLIIDGDSVIHKGLVKEKSICTTNKKTHAKYYNLNREIFESDINKKSLVTNHMIFNKCILKELISFIEEKFKRPWKEVLVDLVSSQDSLSFSEYQLYGDYVLSRYDFILKPIKIFRRFDCIKTGLDHGLEKYDILAFEDHHKTDSLRYLRAKIYFYLGIPLG